MTPYARGGGEMNCVSLKNIYLKQSYMIHHGLKHLNRYAIEVKSKENYSIKEMGERNDN